MCDAGEQGNVEVAILLVLWPSQWVKMVGYSQAGQRFFLPSDLIGAQFIAHS